jgi:trk system potassium uptake protein TrkH
MFEAMSALATVGLSTGITPFLTDAGKLILCAVMFFGRLGPLTAAYALQRHQRPTHLRFPSVAVRIG